MGYAIMRTKKLKMGGAAASLSHTFRERDTPNADPELKSTNQNFAGSVTNTADAMQALRERLPEHYRKDAVVAIEYLMTTSPDWAENATKEQRDQYFIKAKDWLDEKHGKQNVFVAQIHNDEKTPHLVAYVVPLSNTNSQKPNRLCAKDFLGGRGKLSKMQTSFHETVKHFGLERGIEGSRATHQRVKKHYSEISQVREPKEPVGIGLEDIEPQGSLLKKETKAEVVNRINKKVSAQSSAFSTPMVALANEGLQSKRDSEADRKTAKSLEIEASNFKKMTEGLTHDQLEKLVTQSHEMRQQNIALKQRQEQERRDLQAQKQIDALVRDDERKMRDQNKKGPKIGM